MQGVEERAVSSASGTPEKHHSQSNADEMKQNPAGAHEVGSTNAIVTSATQLQNENAQLAAEVIAAEWEKNSGGTTKRHATGSR